LVLGEAATKLNEPNRRRILPKPRLNHEYGSFFFSINISKTAPDRTDS
jgi:hypothetical protein